MFRSKIIFNIVITIARKAKNKKRMEAVRFHAQSQQLYLAVTNEFRIVENNCKFCGCCS